MGQINSYEFNRNLKEIFDEIFKYLPSTELNTMRVSYDGTRAFVKSYFERIHPDETEFIWIEEMELGGDEDDGIVVVGKVYLNFFFK